MVEEIIGDHRGRASRPQPRQDIERLAGGHIEHHQIYHEDDESRSQVLGHHQDQHMEGRQRSGDHNIPKLQRQLEAGRHKEYEHDLHQLRRLDIDPRHRKAQHGASADTAHHNDRRKRDDPHNGIEISHEEIHAKIHEIADAQGKSCEEVEESLSNYDFSYIQNDILMNKLIAFLKSKNA